MEDKELVGGGIGSVGTFSIKIEGNNFVFAADAAAGPAVVGASIKVGLRAALEEIKKATPDTAVGNAVDTLITLIEAGLAV